ncbi:MAG: hypothetical protein KDC65_07715 [Saprospiraceae bacterium]|nr:hypothetical protein [Saprospiraceae bacterium]
MLRPRLPEDDLLPPPLLLRVEPPELLLLPLLLRFEEPEFHFPLSLLRLGCDSMLRDGRSCDDGRLGRVSILFEREGRSR